MTTRKHFKQLVRDRMRQTGERYTVARRHVEASAPVYWELRGGIHGETAAFANVLANLGVAARGRAVVRGDDPGRRRRARRGLHPVGVRRVGLSRAHARVPARVAVPGALGGGDGGAARPARGAARDGRREGRGGRARRPAGPRPAGDRVDRPVPARPPRAAREPRRVRRPADRRLRPLGRRLRDRRPLDRPRGGLRRGAGGRPGARGVLQAPADRDRPGAGGPRRPARRRRGQA